MIPCLIDLSNLPPKPMPIFMSEDFLLSSAVACELYHDYAKHQPIYDYHCHLNPYAIADDRRFDNLGQIWLENDHYKWRAMRTAGIPEDLISGVANDKEKYTVWVQTLTQCIGNPLYHWSHLELKRPFGLNNTLLSPYTAERVWQHCNACLQEPNFSARGILQQMNLVMLGTTDDPIDSLAAHRYIRADPSITLDVVPSWRPDRAFKIDQPDFASYLQQLGQATNQDIRRFSDLIIALEQRMEHFAEHGCRAADHGIEIMRFAPMPPEARLDSILQRALRGELLDELAIAQFSTAVQVWLGQQYAQRGWVMQLHIGAQRNNNTRQFKHLGPDSGFDSISDRPFAKPLAQFLDTLDCDNRLPKTILYTLNPAATATLAAMIGNFQGDGIAGKVQLGAGWWFNDQKDGIQYHLEQVAQLSLLSRFVGMLTDSRSFLSFARHEYFRRILCEKIGQWVVNGEAPHDMNLLGGMVQDICFNNAQQYFHV